MKKSSESFSVRILVKSDGNVFLARSVDYNIIAQGNTDEEAVTNLLSTFIATRMAYEKCGETLEDKHPKAPAELMNIYERTVMFSRLEDREVLGREMKAEIKPMLCAV